MQMPGTLRLGISPTLPGCACQWRKNEAWLAVIARMRNSLDFALARFHCRMDISVRCADKGLPQQTEVFCA
jgi:hypothetical protein